MVVVVVVMVLAMLLQIGIGWSRIGFSALLSIELRPLVQSARQDIDDYLRSKEDQFRSHPFSLQISGV